MRIVVIGAGMVGANVGYRLAQAGADVTLVDAGQPGRGTSGSSFAWLNAFSKQPRDYFDLNVASMQEHLDLQDELGGGEWLTFEGNLLWGADTEKRSELRTAAERLNSWGYAAELLTPAQARALEPDLRFDVDDEIIYVPREGWVSALPLIHALLRAAVALGAELRTLAKIARIERQGSRLTEVVLADGERLAADVVVDCAGPWADEVAQMAGCKLRLDRHPGLLAYSPPIPIGLKRLCHGPGVHFRPDSGGRVVIGQAWHDDNLRPDSPNALTPQALLDEAARWLPALTGVEVEASRIGVRPMPPDGLPMLGFLPEVDNFYVAVSHSGITLGPLWGRLVAQEIVQGSIEPRLAPYRPNRF
jgi:glycine/D-amino acid oxidase-like deaminating enzyme